MESCDLPTVLPCWLAVDLDAVAANIAALRSWVGANVQLAAVVKAQAYGAGAVEIARTARAAGASWLAVARVHEGQELRAAGDRGPILVLTHTDPTEAEAAVAAELAVTVDSVLLGEALGAAARRTGRRAQVHIKVDTGLRRFGTDPPDVLPLVRALSAIEGVELQGLYTHFANADEPDQSFTHTQLARFREVVAELTAAGYRFPLLHASNSAATLAMTAAHFDLVRIGLALYGVNPGGAVPAGVTLRPAVAFRARVARLLTVHTGEGVGYGQTWRAPGPTRVAVVAAGYADGIPRALSNRGMALVNGRVVPVIGRISMDLTTLNVTECSAVQVGTVVTFFGREGEAELSLPRFAEMIGTIPHEALALIGSRVPRVYHRNGQIVRIARLNGDVDAAVPGTRRRPNP